MRVRISRLLTFLGKGSLFSSTVTQKVFDLYRSNRLRGRACWVARPLVRGLCQGGVDVITSKQKYIVAATPRTGSGLLCYGLGATGIAGRPDEVFAPHLRGMWCQYWSLVQNTNFSDYLHAAFRYGTTSNGVYGLKIHSIHVAELARRASFSGECYSILEFLFPDARFVNIVRRDRRAQAISYFRARATNEWEKIEGIDPDKRNRAVPAFDADAILALEADLRWQQLAWEEYFGRHGIEPLIIEYEVLSEDYRGQVARVLAFLGLDASVARLIPPPFLKRQSDDLTLRWRRLLESATSQELHDGEITA